MDDKKFFKEEGDPGFSPERNKAIIEASIKKYEAMRKKKQTEFKDALAERTNAIGSYLKSLEKSDKPAHKYFGRKWMAYLRGEEIRNRLQNVIKRNINKLGRVAGIDSAA